jgi:hypothetical protein
MLQKHLHLQHCNSTPTFFSHTVLNRLSSQIKQTYCSGISPHLLFWFMLKEGQFIIRSFLMTFDTFELTCVRIPSLGFPSQLFLEYSVQETRTKVTMKLEIFGFLHCRCNDCCSSKRVTTIACKEYIKSRNIETANSPTSFDCFLSNESKSGVDKTTWRS